MISRKNSSRKRKQAEVDSPLSKQEERSLMPAFHASLRPLPTNPDISDDEIEDGSEILPKMKEGESEEESEVKSEEDYSKRVKWTGKPSEIKVNFHEGPSGPTSPLPSSRGVTSFFQLMFSRKVWDLLQKQTNIYAAQQLHTKPDRDWKKVTTGELKAWVGCVIAMGISKKPDLSMYWDTTWKLSVVADRFTRDRFTKIKKYLHVADNKAIADSSTSSSDRLAKIRPLIDALVQNFQKQYQPSTHLRRYV